MQLIPGYVFDTGAIIDLARRLTPLPLYKPLHDKCDELVKQGMIVSSKDVYGEIMDGPVSNDQVMVWAGKNKRIFIDIDEDQNELLPLITKEFPKFIDYSKRWHADPLIVAIAMGKNWKVVSGESFSKGSKPHIPDVCKHFKVECKNLFEFIPSGKTPAFKPGMRVNPRSEERENHGL